MSVLPSTGADLTRAAPLLHASFYRFVALPDPDAVVSQLRDMTRDFTGTIWVAEEGLNGMIAGTEAMVLRFEKDLTESAAFDGAFNGMMFKHSPCHTPPFGKMKVHRRKEILPMGIEGIDPSRSPRALDAREWREMLAREDVVLLDNRNSFEFRLGHFRGAIDPGVRHFRDFPEYVKAHTAQWKAQGKTIAMYCTGGIRCEKTAAWMLDSGLNVLQLEGGIIQYFAQMPDAERDWQGECFVFDNRVAIDTHLNETGTTLEQVYQDEPDGAWRLQRAQRLMAAIDTDDDP